MVFIYIFTRVHYTALATYIPKIGTWRNIINIIIHLYTINVILNIYKRKTNAPMHTVRNRLSREFSQRVYTIRCLTII